MYERLHCDGPLSSKLPFPLLELPMDEKPIDALLFPSILHTLLQQSAGLASTIHSATLAEDTAQQDVSQALHILREYLAFTLAVWERYQEEAPLWAGRPEPED